MRTSTRPRLAAIVLAVVGMILLLAALVRIAAGAALFLAAAALFLLALGLSVRGGRQAGRSSVGDGRS